jgi:ABC-type transporter MlaC component
VAQEISLLLNKPSEFVSIIRQEGMQAVIDVVKKNNKPLIIASNIN